MGVAHQQPAAKAHASLRFASLRLASVAEAEQPSGHMAAWAMCCMRTGRNLALVCLMLMNTQRNCKSLQSTEESGLLLPAKFRSTELCYQSSRHLK
ncbi:hypothetical protein FAUST_8955 [Fusarium austroamericanum]|uniref:Uncharacterized protein n=1 Tax=Fusarium austroamericanum TaxID=282268 RepID=A0AAN5Z400_FUSAU|nr:hypothetical protein FAUST_8955 [Fusarium austroamericanum]